MCLFSWLWSEHLDQILTKNFKLPVLRRTFTFYNLQLEQNFQDASSNHWLKPSLEVPTSQHAEHCEWQTHAYIYNVQQIQTIEQGLYTDELH